MLILEDSDIQNTKIHLFNYIVIVLKKSLYNTKKRQSMFDL